MKGFESLIDLHWLRYNQMKDIEREKERQMEMEQFEFDLSFSFT